MGLVVYVVCVKMYNLVKKSNEKFKRCVSIIIEYQIWVYVYIRGLKFRYIFSDLFIEIILLQNYKMYV